MPTTPQQVDLWRSAPSEHQRLEFKEARNQFDSRKLYEYCVALANEGGGQLILGIADTPPRTAVGSAQIIAATIDAGLIKPEKVGGSRKYARYLPYWA
jgi:predicted HTH transcriptional regulator